MLHPSSNAGHPPHRLRDDGYGHHYYGLGLLLTSQTTFIWHLYLFYGVLAGRANSSMNITRPSSSCPEWEKIRGGRALFPPRHEGQS